MLPEVSNHGASNKIAMDKLVPFSNYPLEQIQGYRLIEMVDLIRETRVCEPILVRPIKDGKYEILDGHYRVAAAKKLNFTAIPAKIIRNLSEEEALDLVSDTDPVGLMKKFDVDIYSKGFKKSKAYKKIKGSRIQIDGGYTVSLDEYIEKFLLSKSEVYQLYESIYDMGNPYELNADECTVEAVAREIVIAQKPDPERAKFIIEWKESKDPNDASALRIAKAAIEGEAQELVNTFTRQDGGYIQQIKNYLDIDLNVFDYTLMQNKRERAKMLYFIYTLKRVESPEVNILKLLSKLSMENSDNSFLGLETTNGHYVGYMKHEIEKELPVSLHFMLKFVVSNIVNRWGQYMISGCESISTLLANGWECSHKIDVLRESVKEPFDKVLIEKTVTQHTPLEFLYLRLIQYEYMGQAKDLLKTYKMASPLNDSVPAEYVGAMNKAKDQMISSEDVESYFGPENIRRIAKYVYLKRETSKEDRRKIRNCKEKVLRFLNFLNLADPLGQYDVIGDVSELLIISCLQSILLDGGKEIFDYSFYGMQGVKGNRKGKIYVQAALKREKRPYDALQVYWVRRVMDRYYANLGESNVRKVTSEFEKICIECLSKILGNSSVEEMIAMDEYYRTKLFLPLSIIDFRNPDRP